MDKEQFLNQVKSIQEKRKNLFTQKIHNSERYCHINSTPRSLLSEEETQLILAVENFDKHICYGNENLLLQIRPVDQEAFVAHAEKKLSNILQLLKQINWDE